MACGSQSRHTSEIRRIGRFYDQTRVSDLRDVDEKWLEWTVKIIVDENLASIAESVCLTISKMLRHASFVHARIAEREPRVLIEEARVRIDQMEFGGKASRIDGMR